MHIRKSVKIFACSLLVLNATSNKTLAQSTSFYSSLRNFQVINRTGYDAHGFEIDLQGVKAEDVIVSFNGQRYGDAQVESYINDEVSPVISGVRVRWQSVYDLARKRYLQTTTSRNSEAANLVGCYSWEPGYERSGCERFGLTLARKPTKAIYHWLVENPIRQGELLAVNTETNISGPIWAVAVAKGNQDQIQNRVGQDSATLQLAMNR